MLGDVFLSNEQDFNLVWFFYRCALQSVLHSFTKEWQNRIQNQLAKPLHKPTAMLFVTLANYIINLVGWRDSSQVRRKDLSKQKEATIFHVLISSDSFINYEASQACFQETYQSNIGQLNCIEIQFFFLQKVIEHKRTNLFQRKTKLSTPLIFVLNVRKDSFLKWFR